MPQEQMYRCVKRLRRKWLNTDVGHEITEYVYNLLSDAKKETF